MKDTTIAVIHTAFSWSMDPAVPSTTKFALTFYGNQPAGEIKTNVSRKRGSIVADDLPGRLRTVAKYMKQEDVTSLDEIAERLQEVVA